MWKTENTNYSPKSLCLLLSPKSEEANGHFGISRMHLRISVSNVWTTPALKASSSSACPHYSEFTGFWVSQPSKETSALSCNHCMKAYLKSDCSTEWIYPIGKISSATEIRSSFPDGPSPSGMSILQNDLQNYTPYLQTWMDYERLLVTAQILW